MKPCDCPKHAGDEPTEPLPMPDPEDYQNMPVLDVGYPGFDHEFGDR